MRTHCRNGHRQTKENTYVRKNRGVECLVCKLTSGRRYYSKHKNKLRKKTSAYYRSNKPKCKARQKLYVLKNHARLLAYRRSYGRTLAGKFAMLCSSAKVRNIKVQLSRKEFEKLVSSNACAYCKKPLPETGGGVDRIDNRLGYTINNCSPCCKSCNHKKGCLEMAGFTGHRAVELLTELLANEKTTSIPRQTRRHSRLR